MLEVLFIAAIVVLLHVFGTNFWTLIAFFAMLIFIAPGVYSLLSGAPFIPTVRKRIDSFLELADFKSSDVVYDLGCGDGRVVREVAKFNVREVKGYEYSLPTFLLAKCLHFRTPSSAKIVYSNFWKEDLTSANVIFVFLMDGAMKRFKKDVWPKLKKGTRVLTNEFRLPGVKADASDNFVYLYVKK